MTPPLRIAVADGEPDMCDYYRKVVPLLGHEVIAVATTGRELIDQCRAARPDLVITDIKMPDTDGLDAAGAIYRETPVPVVIVSASCDGGLIERALEGPVLAYLIKPIEQADLAPAIALAARRFREFQALRQEAADLRQALEDRKVIERAKGVLMRERGLDEPEAFRRLQKLARDNHRKMVEIARMILITAEALEAPETD